MLHLQNVGRKPLSLPMALPERPCDPDAEVCNGPKAGHYGELVAMAPPAKQPDQEFHSPEAPE